MAKADLLDLERSWLLLAQSYEFADQLDLFADDVKRQAKPDDAE